MSTGNIIRTHIVIDNEVAREDRALLDQVIGYMGMSATFRQEIIPTQESELKPLKRLDEITSPTDWVAREHFEEYWQLFYSPQIAQRNAISAFNTLVEEGNRAQLRRDRGAALSKDELIVANREEVGLPPYEGLRQPSYSSYVWAVIQAGSLGNVDPTQLRGSAGSINFLKGFIELIDGQLKSDSE